MGKIYKEANKCETETTINVLYSEKILGEPNKEYIKGKSIIGSHWEIPLNNISKINKLILKANIYGM